MGQYYKPAILGNNRKTVKSYMLAHDYGTGLKIMEHSWQNNKFVSTFESLILDNPQRVVWAGDQLLNISRATEFPRVHGNPLPQDVRPPMEQQHSAVTKV